MPRDVPVSRIQERLHADGVDLDCAGKNAEYTASPRQELNPNYDVASATAERLRADAR